jgi:hypothetical protein
VVFVGRQIHQQSLRDFESFDAGLFKDQLQQMVFLSVSNLFFQQNKTELIDVSSEIVAHGKALSAIQVQRSEFSSNFPRIFGENFRNLLKFRRKEADDRKLENEVVDLQEKLLRSVTLFFVTLKDFREEWKMRRNSCETRDVREVRIILQHCRLSKK